MSDPSAEHALDSNATTVTESHPSRPPMPPPSLSAPLLSTSHQQQPLDMEVEMAPPNAGVPPLQFLHVPQRPNSNRRQKSAHLLPPTKVPIPIFTLKKLPPSNLKQLSEQLLQEQLRAQEETMRMRKEIQQLTSEKVQPKGTATKVEERGKESVDKEGATGQRPPTAPTLPTTKSSRDGSAAVARPLFTRDSGSASTAGRVGGSSDVGVSWTNESPRVASATRNRPPPLLLAIETFLNKEMRILADGDGGTVDPMSALQPHREALRMLIDGLPSYSSLLCSIMGAYDNAIKNQATVTSVARVVSSNAVQVRLNHEDEVKSLRAQMSSLEKKCEQTKASLMAKVEEAKAASHPSVLINLETENRSLKNAIVFIEQERSGDMEKIMTLIAAVKECDFRVKTLEDALLEARQQLEEMSSLRKMMVESQEELGQMKETYRNSVPMSRFNATRRDLERTLEECRQETKRVRRLCILRGSHIDNLEKNLKAAKDQLEAFQQGTPKTVREAFTPRPDWALVHSRIPELKDLVSCTPVPMLDQNVDAPVRMMQGPVESRTQVEFLTDKVVELQSTLAALQLSGGGELSADSAAGSGTTGSPGLHPKHRASIHSGPSLTSSPMGKTQTSSPTSASNSIATQIPLLGWGVAPNIPQHLRAIGAIPRISLDAGRYRELIHDFFASPNLRKVSLPLIGDPDEFARQFVIFATVQFASNVELRNRFKTVQALAYNLHDPTLPFSNSLSPLFLFRSVQSGAMPIRLAFDAIDIENETRNELTALGESHNKQRLRRTTVLELIVPLLSFKSREELDELRNSLGVDNTIDIAALVSQKSKFVETLFDQECTENMRLFATLVDKFTAAATPRSDGVMCLTTSSVLTIVGDVEPRTTQTVLDSLIVGEYTEEVTFPLEHTLTALRTASLIRITAKSERSDNSMMSESKAASPGGTM